MDDTHPETNITGMPDALQLRDKRLTDLADILGISRQACNQAVKQVEAAGYIERRTDPTDGRAKLLALSPEGIRLRRDGVRIVAGLDHQFATIVGESRIADASPDGDKYEAVHDAFEKALVAHVLGLTGGNQVQAARQLGIHRTTLRKLIDRYGL